MILGKKEYGAVMRSELFQSGLAFLVWFQEVDMSVSSKYDVDFTAMKFIAASLSSRECYDFYHLLSHRRAKTGRISIYAEKEKAQEVSCISLLATWLTDPSESTFRSNENIELKLRAIGRKDLARWMLNKIDSTLKRRRRLNADEIHEKHEETDGSPDAIIRNRTGNRIIPLPFVEDESIMKNYEATEEKQASCVFLKVFFSSLVVILLVILILCFYKFVYTKLRCICQRFNNVDDEEYCLPEQKYGTTSRSNVPTKISRERKFVDSKIGDAKAANDTRKNFETSERFSETTETNDEIFSTFSTEKRSLLHNNASKSTKINPTNSTDSSSNSKNTKSMNFPIKSSRKFIEKTIKTASLVKNSEKIIDSFEKNYDKTTKNYDDRDVFHDYGKIDDKSNIFESTRREIEEKSMKIDEKKSEMILSRLRENNASFKREKTSPRWISCSCNLMEKSAKNVSSARSTKSEKLENLRRCENTIVSPCESPSGLSETYDELGMLFSRHFKLQWKACERKYCALRRKLRRDKMTNHDVRKCRFRGRRNYHGDVMIITKWDERPGCSSGNICPETYDEYEIMRSTKEEREKLARTIIERRKSFLDQPCLSPVAVKNHR